jgi:DNA polymerase III epsilon subunit-like protein
MESAVDFRRSLIENSAMSVLNADIAVKAAMGAGLSTPSVGQSAQGDGDGKKRVNKGGVPGMDETEDGYRYIPDATWGPGKTLKLFPSRDNRQSSNKVPNFGFVDQDPIVTPEQYIQQMENKPKIRMSKYKVNSRTGEPIDDTEVEFDRMRFGKTFDINPDASDEIDELASEEIQEKSLGRTLKQRMPGGSLVGRAAARFGVIMDELGKMRCPPGTPAANQFTDMTGSNCFGTSPGTLISEAINLAQRLVPDDDPRRSSGTTRRIVNMMFDLDNGIFGNNVWYHADGTRMKHGEWRKFREAGGVAKNERWMVNGVDRTLSELDSQDARMEDLYRRLGVDTDDARKATNEDVFDAFQKLRDSGVIRARLDGRPTPAQVEAMMTSRLKNMDAHWIARTDAEKKALLDIEVKRYRELERAHIEAFLDEVIKNPEHMKTIGRVTFNPTGRDRASFGIDRIGPDGNPVGSINIDIPTSMEFQDSMLPNLSPDERLRIWAEGGTSDTLRAMAVKDFLVNSNSHAGEMMAMVDGGRGLGRHDMKHEIAHSIQAVAIFNHMKRELDARGSLIINRGKDKNGNDKPPLTITDVSQLNSDMLMALMSHENYAGIDLDALKNLRSRADVVAFLGGRYIDQFPPGESQRAMEIGAELWALRSAGLIYGDDVDAALEYMDDVASGKITIDRTVSDSMLTRRVYEEHLDGSRRIREAREARERDREYAEAALAESDRLAEEAADSADDGFFDADERAAAARVSAAREAYAAEKRAEVKSTKEKAKTMTEDEMVDFLTDSTETSDMLSEMLDALEESGEEADWMAVMDRDALDEMSKAVVDAWVKRFTVRRSAEAMEKLQKMIDDKRESRGTLSSEKIKERQFRNFKEDAEERAKDMELDDLVQSYSDWDELASEEGVDGVDRAFRKELRDMYREEYIKRRTEGPDSVSREDARKEFNSKFKTMRKPKTTAAREREKRANPKKFKTHNGKDGARTFATQERERLLEGATTAEKVAFVEMGSGDTDVINMMSGTEEGMAAARAIQRRNTRLRKNGVLPDELNHHEASIEQQVENFYIPLVELMDKSSLSQTVEMHIDSNDDAARYVADLLNGNPPEFTVGIGTGTLVTDKTDFSDGKKIIIRVPEGSRALFPDWSFYSDSDNGEQKMMIPPSKFHLVEVRDDGTVVLEVGEQRGTEEILKDAVNEIGPGDGGAGDVAYRQGLQKKVDRVVEKRIAERRAQGIFDPEKRSPVEEERFSASADNSAAAAGFTPDAPPRPTTPEPTRPAPKRGVDRKRSTAAIDRAKDYPSAQQELEAVHAFITGEGAFQNRSNAIGLEVASIMDRAFGTRNISELTEEQKYDLIDLISERMNKAPSRDQRGLSQARSRIQDHVDISKMMNDNNYSDPYSGGSSFNLDYLTADSRFRPILGGEDRDSFSSGAKWGQMPSSNEQISRLLNSANNDGFNEIYGPPQTREERIAQMAEMQSEVLSSLREIADNIPGSGNELGLSASNIDPVILDLVKNSSDEELYEIISKAAMDLHQSFDARPRVRMREDELEKFIETQRYGRESSFDSSSTTFSSGLVRRGIKARAKERAVEMIAERIGKDEDSREIAEMVLNTASSLRYGPEAALTRLAIDLGRRGSRDIAERTVQELVERGKITDEQAKSIMSKIDKVAPEGLPDPLKRGVGRAARAAADALDTPENRERLDNARQAAGEAADRAREAVGEGARNLAERGRERLRRLRERDDRGEIPSSPEDVPFGDFDPADSTFSSGRRLDRRVSNSEVGRERIMDGAKKTRTRFSSGATPERKEPKEPFKPRDPDNGPMTGKFIDIFRGVKSYQEMLDRYNEQEVVFFDYETTGLDHTVEKPVQIGAVRMKGGKVVERFNIFVNPKKPLSDWSLENLKDADGNPLTDEWLSGQPSIREAHEQLLEFFGPDALLGGQYTPFDLNFLEQSLKDSGLEYTPAGVIDSKPLADELLPVWTPDGDGPSTINKNGKRVPSNSLKPLAEYLGVELDAWHTADADSLASAGIVQKILERAAADESVPKHLLSVENIPGIVAERRAKHKIAMDKYFADMKQYNADMEEFKASQGGDRLSSGRTDLMGGRENPRSISVDKQYGDTSGSKDFSQEQLKTIDAINERLSNSGINFEWISLENEDGTATSSPLVNFADRPIVAVRIDEDTVVPFYRSTGLSGKDQDLYPAGKWYPFWGYSSGSNLFIKDEGMQDYYGVPELEDISKQLDSLTEGLPKLRNAEWRNVENLEERKPHPIYGTTSGSMNEDFLTLINNTSKRYPELNPNSISWSKKRARQIISSEKKKNAKSERKLFSNGGEEQTDTGTRFSSGAKYQEIVDAQKPLSKEKKKSISEFAEDLSGEEFQKEDVYKLDDGPKPPRPPGVPEPKPVLIIQDDEKRAKEKRRVHESMAKIFAGEMELDKDVIITAEDGTQLNIGKKVLVEVVPKADWAPGAKIKRFSKDDAAEQDELGLYDKTIEEGDLMTELQLEFRIKPLPEYNDRLIATFSDEDKRRYVSRDDGTPAIATSYRTLMQISGDDKDIKLISHDSFYVTGRAQGQGIGSAFNARNEQIYKELDVRSIFTEGSSGGGSTGAVHWPKNGFTWAGEKDKQKFMKVIDDAITEKPELFSEEERKKISSLYRKNPDTGMFETEATAEELVSFTEAKKVFADVDALILYTRPLREFAGASSGERFSSGKSDKRDTNIPVSFDKEFEFKRGKVKEEKTNRMSSGKINRDLKPGSLKKETSEIVGTDNGYSKKKFTVHEIGDEKVVFGATRDNGADLSGVTRVAINPYEISGYSNTSQEGREFAMKWTAAHAAQMAENNNKTSTKVDALLYAAARGDSDAMSEFELLAAKGERLIEEERNMQSRETLGWERPWPGNPDWRRNDMYMDASEEAIEKEGLADLGVEDLYLVHETSYDLVEDADGNLVLRPLGDHELKKMDGSPGEYHRDTLHFALNHIAGGHMMRPEAQGNVIIVPLSAVLEKNPDSLDALFAVDTYLVPKPGEPLVIPKGAFKTVPKGSSNPREEAEKALKEMGATKIFQEGDSYSSRGVDARISQLASEMGVQSTIHANIVHSYMEARVSDSEPEYAVTARELAQMSPNARMRLADNDRFSSVKTETDNTRFSSGATGRSSAKPASAEGPRANKPKRVKKYKGYELKEPDNPEPKPGEFPDDVVEAAKKHRAEIEKVEAEITKLLIDLAEKNNARMEGLDFRLKALKSLMRKIAAEKDSEHGGDAQKAAEAMSDVVRYTMSYGEEDYVDGVKDVVEQMQKLGYDLRIKNYWQSDDPYQGINVAVTHPDGTKFELQFHTPQSVAEKEKIHLMYEDYRGSTDPKQRWELYQKMVEIANKIGVPVPPEELLSIGEIKVQPFS